MSTYRYARTSNTPAQREAAKWQAKVDQLRDLLAMFRAQIADNRPLSAYDSSRYTIAENKLAKLLSENPNEPV